MTNGTPERISEASCLSQGTPGTSVDAFPHRAPGRHGFPSTFPAGKGPLSSEVLRSVLIQWKVDVRVSHHPLPTTPRTREIISARTKQTTGQRFRTRQKARRDEQYGARRKNWTTEKVNSTQSARTRSPRNPTLLGAVVGVVVLTSFPPSCHCRCFSDADYPNRPAESSDSLTTSLTLSSYPETR
ncbi:hypothetical protein CRG98_021075 [Punica granatum]|uniref:Uncharacterized protein n=1 Tax=Punica granatum TaxID=22663 RepID=A0A2I0JQE1_PUNGR|nr:hypothetical protein CRG98_021075 [Punica granatum]